MTNFTLYDFETHITGRARPYNVTFYRLRKLAVSCNRDLTPHEIEKSKKDTLVFHGDNCVSSALDFLLKFRGEERKTIDKKFVEYNLHFHAHNGRGFDTWIILNNLPCYKHIVDNNKNGKGIISMKIFIGQIHNGKRKSSISNFQMWYNSVEKFVEKFRKNN